MKPWLVLALVLAGCADPVERAHDEFELISPPDLPDELRDTYPRDRSLDEGDFIGRVRTLFGEQPNNSYELRHKPTGILITVSAGNPGPRFGGADNVLAARPVFARLVQLADAVPPTDWSEMRYEPNTHTISQLGAERGRSFVRELAPADGMTFLLDQDSAWDYRALSYFAAHHAELAGFKPRVREIWTRFERSLDEYGRPSPDLLEELQVSALLK